MFIENDLSYIRKKKSSKLMISKAVFVNIYVIANITYLGKNGHLSVIFSQLLNLRY